MRRRLVREVVADALYHPADGYFARTAAIHALPAPLDFKRMRGRRDYDNAVAALYAEAQGEAWHTPAETLKVRARTARRLAWTWVTRAEGRHRGRCLAGAVSGCKHRGSFRLF